MWIIGSYGVRPNKLNDGSDITWWPKHRTRSSSVLSWVRWMLTARRATTCSCASRDPWPPTRRSASSTTYASMTGPTRWVQWSPPYAESESNQDKWRSDWVRSLCRAVLFGRFHCVKRFCALFRGRIKSSIISSTSNMLVEFVTSPAGPLLSTGFLFKADAIADTGTSRSIQVWRALLVDSWKPFTAFKSFWDTNLILESKVFWVLQQYFFFNISFTLSWVSSQRRVT